MAQLAIKGHPTRGNEVIQLLEMLGGVNAFNLEGSVDNYYYYIDKNSNKIYHCLSINLEYGIVYTLEEFLEKFPYKAGNKVVYKFIRNYIIDTIKSMKWYANGVVYTLKGCEDEVMAEDLQPYKEETIEESIDKTNKVIFETNAQCCDIRNEIIKKDMKEIKIDIPNGYEFFGIDDDNKIVLTEKQPQYPKTYEECCNILGIEDRENGYCGYEYELLGEFQKLYICRNAYWKIAGEEMGLDKPWKPDFTNIDNCYLAIKTCKGEISLISTLYIEDCILVFPTKEMRDVFYENFKELIEQCKELL